MDCTNTEKVSNLLKTSDSIYMDTSSLMCPGFEMFVKTSEKAFIWNAKKITIIPAVNAELYRHVYYGKEYPYKKANKAMEIIDTYTLMFQKEGQKKPNNSMILNSFADQAFLEKFVSLRKKNTILFITNDKSLGFDIQNLNKIHSCRGKKILVYSVNERGDLETLKYKEQYSFANLLSTLLDQVMHFFGRRTRYEIEA